MSSPQLKKELTAFGLTMIAIGSCIGSGIFKTPSGIANYLGDGTYILIVWAVGGLVAMCGALTFAELGVRFPQTGGVYVYLKEAYGDLVAFLYGWTILTVVTSGALAALSLVFASYLGFLFPLGDYGEVLIGIGAIVLVTLVNVVSVKGAESFSNIFTMLKLIGILLIVGVGVFMAQDFIPTENVIEAPKGMGLMTAFGGALVGVFWSYGGWHHASYLSGETKNPTKNVPRAMIVGSIVVTLAYLLANVAYLKLLPIGDMATSSAVASDAVNTVFSSGAKIIAALIVISTIGTIGIYTMSAPRIYFTMAKDGVFFKGLSAVHPRFKTPMTAVLLQSSWAIVLILFWQTFENLITYVVFMDWIFMILGAISVFLFRKRLGVLSNFNIPLYPITPLIFISISILFIIITLYNTPEQAVAGLVLLGIGLPVYYWFKRKKI